MKYFIVSDIHSFASQLKSGLRAAGFNKRNKDHILIVCGDVFDRGSETVEVYKYLKNIPKSRCILIRGNHELLYFKLLNKSFPGGHDFHNGTVDTFCQIARTNYNGEDRDIADPDYLDSAARYSKAFGEELDIDVKKDWDIIRQAVEKSEITKWLKSAQWRDYYELDKYIFVHSFIPTKLKQEYIDKYGINAYGFENSDCYEYDKDWRKLSTAYWDRAVWGCPFSQYKEGLFKSEEDSGKVLVVGHWHTSDFYKNLKNINTFTNECGPIYFSKGLIGIDGGAMYDYYAKTYIHPQNVLVIEDNTCYDKNGNKLEEPKRVPIIKTVILK